LTLRNFDGRIVMSA